MTVFSPCPGKNDWYETVKLNYGVDYVNGRIGHFQPGARHLDEDAGYPAFLGGKRDRRFPVRYGGNGSG